MLGRSGLWFRVQGLRVQSVGLRSPGVCAEVREDGGVA